HRRGPPRDLAPIPTRRSSDLQVLAPMYRSEVGIHAINQTLQQLINPKSRQKREVFFNNDTYFRVGDKVIQLVNQPEDNIFNGDIDRKSTRLNSRHVSISYAVF